jgi:hypothetical protein
MLKYALSIFFFDNFVNKFIIICIQPIKDDAYGTRDLLHYEQGRNTA